MGVSLKEHEAPKADALEHSADDHSGSGDRGASCDMEREEKEMEHEL